MASGASEVSEMQKHNVLRLSNEESNRLTRECLQKALVRLLKEKSLEKISITELVKVAGVSRTAFYSNYSTKEDILISWSKESVEILNSIARDNICNDRLSEMYMQIFEHFRSEKEDVDVLIKAGLETLVFDSIEKTMLERIPENDPSARYLLSGWCGMLAYIIMQWYKDGMKDSTEHMASLLSRLSESFITEIRKSYPDFPNMP